jgi:hypothetical protein
MNVDTDIIKDYIIYFEVPKRVIKVYNIKIVGINDKQIRFTYSIHTEPTRYTWYILIKDYMKLSRIKKLKELKNVN